MWKESWSLTRLLDMFSVFFWKKVWNQKHSPSSPPDIPSKIKTHYRSPKLDVVCFVCARHHQSSLPPCSPSWTMALCDGLSHCKLALAFAVMMDLLGGSALLVGVFAPLEIRGRDFGDLLVYTGMKQPPQPQLVIMMRWSKHEESQQ